MRIPFDSVVLSAVLEDLAPFVGGTVQDVRQPDEHTVCLGIYKGGDQPKSGQEAMLLLSAHPIFSRAYLVTRRPSNLPQPTAFCGALRSRIDSTRLVEAIQIAADRLLLLRFQSTAKGEHVLIAELMGKHSNLILLDDRNNVISALKWVGPDKSKRPITPKSTYTWPPVLAEDLLGKPSPQGPAEWFQFATEQPDRVSPFFKHLVQAMEPAGQWEPVLVAGEGAYPLELQTPGLKRATISIALEQHFATAIANHEVQARRSALAGALNRTLLARETAVADLTHTLENDAKAASWQLNGELILAYGASLPPNAKKLEAWDYQGDPVEIRLNPELDFKENANAYFERAKRAKSHAGTLADQLSRLDEDRQNLLAFLARIEATTRLQEIEDLWVEAKRRRWFTEQIHAKSKEDRPYEGHRIRELLAPGGFRVLYGENAESNDYLTLRVAKPNDMWLHVRGSLSAHVVILTGNHPEKINKELLLFAAKVAVQQSPSKHAGFVPVDYTLRRYVRRPRGAPKGTALYTHEKTLHIES